MNRLDWFSVFKYLVYAALIANAALFFMDDWEAAAHVFQDSLPFARIIEGFAPSIDTAAWVILLLLFELETCQLSDEALNRPIGRIIRGLRALCYMVIVYAFTGYLGKALGFGLYVPADIADVCDLAIKQFALLVELDEYRALTAGNCAGITGDSVRQRTDQDAGRSPGALAQATRLAWVDVVNSGTWLLILALLELDVRPSSQRIVPGLVCHRKPACQISALRHYRRRRGVLGTLRHLPRFLGRLSMDRRLRLHRTQCVEVRMNPRNRGGGNSQNTGSPIRACPRRLSSTSLVEDLIEDRR